MLYFTKYSGKGNDETFLHGRMHMQGEFWRLKNSQELINTSSSFGFELQADKLVQVEDSHLSLGSRSVPEAVVYPLVTVIHPFRI